MTPPFYTQHNNIELKRCYRTVHHRLSRIARAPIYFLDGIGNTYVRKSTRGNSRRMVEIQ